MFNVEGADTGIQGLKNWYSKIGAPVTLKEGNIPEKDIPMLVDKLSVVAGIWGAEALYTKEITILICLFILLPTTRYNRAAAEGFTGMVQHPIKNLNT